MTPLVTVGIPFFNEERWLADAIRSILGQTLTDFELLLVDDGSTDRSVEIARSFDDPRIQLVVDGRRRSLAARLNQIASLAHGQYVARMDADDIAHPRRLDRELALLTDGRHDVVGSWVGLIDERTQPFAVLAAEAGELTARRTLEHGALPHPTLVAPRAWFRANAYDESLTRTEDRDLWCRTFATTRFGVAPEPLYLLRFDASEASFVATYLETHRQTRALFLRHGPRMVGWPHTARVWGKSLAKSAVMRIADRVGLTSAVVHRRGRPPTAAELALMTEALG